MTIDVLKRQLEIAWALATYHLESLTTQECLWRPAPIGPHVFQAADGSWRADWPEQEGYALGPPSIAWITWHMAFWWSMTLNHSFGDASLTREDVVWAGSADEVRRVLVQLHDEWRIALASLGDDDVQLSARTRWPMQDRPFADVIAWLNVELMKNAAEIGYARFLYATRHA